MRVVRTVLAMTGLFALSASVVADLVTFTHAGRQASGTLNGVPFSDALFTFTATADTDNIVSLGVDDVFTLDHNAARVTISGVGTFDFITGTRTFVAANSIVGFAREGTGSDLYDGPASAAFAGYDLSTSIQVSNGLGTMLNWGLPAMETTGGTLVFDSAAGLPNASFTARVVPGPAGVTVLLVGFAGVARRRR